MQSTSLRCFIKHQAISPFQITDDKTGHLITGSTPGTYLKNIQFIRQYLFNNGNISVIPQEAKVIISPEEINFT